MCIHIKIQLHNVIVTLAIRFRRHSIMIHNCGSQRALGMFGEAASVSIVPTRPGCLCEVSVVTPRVRIMPFHMFI